MKIKDLNNLLEEMHDLADSDFDSFVNLISNLAKIVSMVQVVSDKLLITNIQDVLKDMDGEFDEDFLKIIKNLDTNNEGEA